MSTARARPMVLDGHSVDAAVTQRPEHVSAVQAVILDIYRVCGPLADHELVRVYEQRVENLGGIPHASPQSIRTRRADLEHRGIVGRTAIEGRSEYGRPCSVYALADQDRVPLW